MDGSSITIGASRMSETNGGRPRRRELHTWIRVDVDYWIDERVMKVGELTAAKHLQAIAWSRKRSTDGLIPGHVPAAIGIKPRQVAALVDAGLWVIVDPGNGGGWRVNAYEKWQETSESVAERREAQRKWQADKRARDLPSNVTPIRPNVMHDNTMTNG